MRIHASNHRWNRTNLPIHRLENQKRAKFSEFEWRDLEMTLEIKML